MEAGGMVDRQGPYRLALAVAGQGACECPGTACAVGGLPEVVVCWACLLHLIPCWASRSEPT